MLTTAVADFDQLVWSDEGADPAVLRGDKVNGMRQKANALLSEMETEGRALLETSGVPAEHISYRREADIRYVCQGHEIRVPLPAGQLDSGSVPAITASFEEVYRRLYERLSQSVPIEIINWRVTVSSPSTPVAELPPVRPAKYIFRSPSGCSSVTSAERTGRSPE